MSATSGLLRLGLFQCLLLSALWGGVQTLCFDNQPSAWLAWFAWVPLAWLALESRWPLARRIFMGWCAGTVFWLINVSWLVRTIGEHGGLPGIVAWSLVGLLALYLGLYSAAFVWIGTWVRWLFGRGQRCSVGRTHVRGTAVLAVLVVVRSAALSAGWVLLEIVREWMFTGFPWSPAGEALVRTPGALEVSAWVGVRGLSFVVLWINIVLAQFIHANFSWYRNRAHRSANRSCAIAVHDSSANAAPSMIGAGWVLVVSMVLVASGLSLGVWHGDRITGEAVRLTQKSGSMDSASFKIASGESAERLLVRIVQPNIPIGASAKEATRNYHRLLRLSECGPEAELILWPESAAFPWSWQRSAGLQRDVTRALRGRCSLLFNSSLRLQSASGEMGDANTAILATPPAETRAAQALVYAGTTGELAIQRYDKNHLVPYGEYVPLKRLLPFVGQLARGVGEFERGTKVNLLHWREVAIGVSICFEVLFPKEVAERVRLGATALVTMTNDAWFGDTRGPRQHLVSARFRAAESRLPMLFVTTTGISAAIDGRGRVVRSLPWGAAETLSLDLQQDLGHSATPTLTWYVRRPWTVDVVMLLLFTFAMFLLPVLSRRLI